MEEISTQAIHTHTHIYIYIYIARELTHQTSLEFRAMDFDEPMTDRRSCPENPTFLPLLRESSAKRGEARKTHGIVRTLWPFP